jgi:citrate lyase subunit beta/citryl-CoA lyase
MRSLLFVPADSERKLARGPQSGADALILDLEDSVVPANRDLARRLARAFLAQTPSAPFRRYVRINALGSGAAPVSGGPKPAGEDPRDGAGLADLAAVMPGRPDGVLLPKCVPADLRTLDHYLAAFEAAHDIPSGKTRVVAIATETPAAMFALGSYAGVSARLEAITWGAEDLAACIGGDNRRVDGLYDDVYRLARALCLIAAAAAGVAAIDTIFTDFRDAAGLAAECAAARRSGFTAKMAIHPAQIPAINAAFSVSHEGLAWARKVVAAFAEHPEAGTIALDGKMIDRPHLTLARRLIEQSAAEGEPR